MSRRADTASRTAGFPGPAVPDLDSGVGPASMTTLAATALAELERHGNADGVCSGCGEAWPCEIASLAAFTLEAVGGR